MKRISVFFVLLAIVSSAVPVRFLGIDESRGQLIYVNMKNAAENWALKLPEKCRDYQMLSPTRLLLNGRRGYYELDLPSFVRRQDIVPLNSSRASVFTMVFVGKSNS